MTQNVLEPTSDPISILKSAVRNWPRAESDKRSPSNSAIAQFVSPDFEQIDFASDVTGVSKIRSVEGPDARKVVIFEDEKGYQYQATMVLSATSGWRVKSIKFQCPVCFGTGINDDETCTMCGGAGWGAE